MTLWPCPLPRQPFPPGRTGCGKRRQTPDRAFLGLSPAQSSLLSQMHTAARWRGFPETSHPSSRIRPTSEAALSADIRADFPQKTSALRKASCFSPPRVATADAEQKDYRKSMFSLSPRENSRAPRASAPGVPMTHVFDAPHGNDARALFFPRQHAPPPAEQAEVSQAAWGSLTDSSGEKAAAHPAFSRSAQEHSAWRTWRQFPQTAGGISRRGTSQNPAQHAPSIGCSFAQPKNRPGVAALLPGFPVSERKKGGVKHAAFFISTLQPQARRLLPPFPRPRRDEWEP